NPVAKEKNNAQGTARTHDIYVIPGAASDPGPVGEIVAQAAPAHIAASEVMGPWHPKDVERFPKVEAAIDDFFTRTIFVSQRVFPPTGYLHYGLYPYAAQPW